MRTHHLSESPHRVVVRIKYKICENALKTTMHYINYLTTHIFKISFSTFKTTPNYSIIIPKHHVIFKEEVFFLKCGHFKDLEVKKFTPQPSPIDSLGLH